MCVGVFGCVCLRVLVCVCVCFCVSVCVCVCVCVHTHALSLFLSLSLSGFLTTLREINLSYNMLNSLPKEMALLSHWWYPRNPQVSFDTDRSLLTLLDLF